MQPGGKERRPVHGEPTRIQRVRENTISTVGAQGHHYLPFQRRHWRGCGTVTHTDLSPHYRIRIKGILKGFYTQLF